MNKLDRFMQDFRFDRQLTLDLLAALSDEELRWSPGPTVGELWKQFRHLGRVQENYIAALDTGTVRFSPEGSYKGAADGKALAAYLGELNQQLTTKLAQTDENKTIDWFGSESLSPFEHLRRMMSHETLHHGQLVVYIKLLNKPFPDSWKIWGL